VELDLHGRGCVVTGAGRGIGRVTARRLCAEGAHVVLVARTEPEVEAAAREAAAEGGRASHPDEDWRQQFELNVMAPLRAMRAAAPPMAERGWGRIVNVASTAGKRPSAKMPEYSVAKAAELSLSRLFADRYAAKGVLVNAVCPGPVESELWMEPGGLLDQSQELSGAASREEALREAGAKRPIGRLATADEIAAAIVFLCSERASYVAGAAWSVDGGTVQVII
jgi:NAD(P)-dependent dehydrogenase (short-subunit alcohol dehydrogenase family)